MSLSKKRSETLAVIAYNQPVTRQEIESIRGVNPEASIETLMEKDWSGKLVERRLNVPNCTVLQTSFLSKALLNSLDDCRPWNKGSQHRGIIFLEIIK